VLGQAAGRLAHASVRGINDSIQEKARERERDILDTLFSLSLSLSFQSPSLPSLTPSELPLGEFKSLVERIPKGEI
jgi:hypothetical protein